MKILPHKSALIAVVSTAAGIASLMLAHAQGTVNAPACSPELAAELAAVEQQPTIDPSALPNGGVGATYYSAQFAGWAPLPCNIYGVPVWDLGDNHYLLDDLAISYPTNAPTTAATMTAMTLSAKPMGGGFSPMDQTQSGVPYLTIAETGTNAVLVTVYNDIGPTNYEIWTTPVLINPEWTMATNGVTGQTNFNLPMGQFYTGFFRAVLDTNGIPLWELADPNNPSAGILTVYIDSPANGAVIQ